MSRIRIKNFGPVKEGLLENDGWIEINKITVFIGNQGSGKSTVAKLISTFTWIEKALTRGDYDFEEFTDEKRFETIYCSYHKIDNYFVSLNGKVISEIEYEGESYSMSYMEGKFSIQKNDSDSYHLPQIMYVPAERNFITNLKSPQSFNLQSRSLLDFLSEYENSKDHIKSILRLPINNAGLEYDGFTDTINILGNGYKVNLLEASSGFQSLVPLFLVSWYLSDSILGDRSKSTNESISSDKRELFRKEIYEILKDNNFNNEQRRILISELSRRFNKTAFINIVEEPEQNLYPNSQWQILNSLLVCNNSSQANKLIITTHSPYIINYISIAIQAGFLVNKIKKSNNHENLLNRLELIIPEISVISASDVVIYQMDDIYGKISKLSSSEGIPSDNNYLNLSLRHGNEMFDSLLEIEQEL